MTLSLALFILAGLIFGGYILGYLCYAIFVTVIAVLDKEPVALVALVPAAVAAVVCGVAWWIAVWAINTFVVAAGY